MEIEKKFIVDLEAFNKFLEQNEDHIEKPLNITQYYIPTLKGTFRIRETLKPDYSLQCTVTVKNFISKGVNEEAEVIIHPIYSHKIITGMGEGLQSISKLRYKIDYEGLLWEVDIFQNGLELGVAEVELDDINKEVKEPYFVREEVTGNYRFSNEYLAVSTSI